MNEKLLSLQLAYGRAIYAQKYWAAAEERLRAEIETLAATAALDPSQDLPDGVDAGGAEK
jgi:hypothetical protein